jgi:hypothetical protein
LPGEIRVSESSLPKGVSLTKEKSKNLEVISILEGEKATSYFVLVEVFPRIQSNKSPPLIPHSSTDAATLHHFKSEWENFINPDVIKVKDEENETKDDLSNDTWKDVLSAYEDSPIPSPNNHYYKPSDSIDLSEIPSVQSFGICNTHETVWINWIALTTTETVLYGLCSYDVASSSPKYESLIKMKTVGHTLRRVRFLMDFSLRMWSQFKRMIRSPWKLILLEAVPSFTAMMS